MTRVTLRSTFSIFPDGAPGIGLVLLRVIAGAALGFYGFTPWMVASDSKKIASIVAMLAIACGLLLLLGLLTWLASSLSALISITTALSLMHMPAMNDTSSRLSAVFTAVIAVALLCLGPGAYSLDARRHGRREIVIPARRSSSTES